MARSFTNVKLISAFVADRFCVIAARRGYAAAAASQGGGMSSGEHDGVGSTMNMMMKKGGGEEAGGERTTSWVPDPVTGYYRPETHANEIDAAELRNMLLNHKH